MAMVGDAPTKTAIAPKNRGNRGDGRRQQRSKGQWRIADPEYSGAICKDLSFEGGAPNSLRARDKARTSISGSTSPNPLSESEFDVVLTLNAKAEVGEEVLFNVELVYGVLQDPEFPQEHMLPLLFIECPRLLFPFSRQIIAECTRNGGFRR
jgi:preprotein translocase subunit SecB